LEWIEINELEKKKKENKMSYCKKCGKESEAPICKSCDLERRNLSFKKSYVSMKVLRDELNAASERNEELKKEIQMLRDKYADVVIKELIDDIKLVRKQRQE
jgi:hypothetical protein